MAEKSTKKKITTIILVLATLGLLLTTFLPFLYYL